jgi:exosortase E/protease (VPEID-CTERM system)
MTVAPPDSESAPGTAARLPYVRWAILTVVLLAEVGILSAAYDAANRGRDAGWAGSVVAWTPAIFRWAFVAAGLAIVLAFWFLHPELLGALRTSHPRGGLTLAVAGNLLAYGLFAVCTGWVMDQEDDLRPWELIVWLVAGISTVTTWALAILPPGAWRALAWRGRWVWLLAAVIAAVTTLVARAARDEWDRLSEPSMGAAYGLLRFVLPETKYYPEAHQLGTERFWVEVGIPCSGYEGIGLMAVYVVIYLVLFRQDLRFPRAYLLIPLALTAVWATNVLRLVALIWIGNRISPTLAKEGFHSQAGWIGFNAVALSLLILAHRSRMFTRNHSARATGPDPTTAYLLPLLAAIAVQMLAAALSPQPELLYPVRMLFAGGLLCYFWPRYTALRTSGCGSASVGTAWALAAGVSVFLIWLALVGTETLFDPVADQPRWLAAWWIVAKVIGFVIVTPLAEELAFRGYLMRRLISADFEAVSPRRFTWVSLLVSSILFGLMHGEWLAGILAGLAYGIVVVRTGRLRDAVFAHSLTNGLLILASGVA